MELVKYITRLAEQGYSPAREMTTLWRNVDVNYTVLSGVISIARSVLKTPENDGIHRTFSAEIGQ